MSQQPAEESTVNEQMQHAENRARLLEACDHDMVATRKAQLARASRPGRRVAMLTVD